jgi:hypothetical protein
MPLEASFDVPEQRQSFLSTFFVCARVALQHR